MKELKESIRRNKNRVFLLLFPIRNHPIFILYYKLNAESNRTKNMH